MISFGDGYSCTWRILRIDPATWAGTEEVGEFLAASVERDCLSMLLESGTAEFDGNPSDSEMWVRIEMLAEQGGLVERHAIATMLMSPAGSSASVGGSKTEYECRSVLAPAEDRVLLAGDYAPAGCDGAEYAASLIAKCTPAPVLVEGSFTLTDHMVFAKGTTHIEAAWMLLDSAGWCAQVSGDGTITVRQMPTQPSLVLDDAAAKLLGTEVKLEGALAEIPNRYIAVDGDQSAIAIDDDPENPASFYSRGRYVDVYDDSPFRVDGESLEAYAARKLVEASESIESREYEREWRPNVTCFDVVKGSLSSVGLDGYMRVTSQSISIGAGALVTEKAEVLRW